MQALADAVLTLVPELGQDVSLPLGIGIAALSSLAALLLRELLGLPAIPIQARTNKTYCHTSIT